MLKMIDPDTALRLVLEHTPPGQTERRPVSGSLGRVLAQRVAADRDYPPFDRAMMDGFAVRPADRGQWVEVLGEVAAGGQFPGELAPGTCVAIMTGAPCPRGTGAVVPVERARREGGRVLLPAQVDEGQHIVPRGRECARGREVAGEGTVISPLVSATLATVGAHQVQVWAEPSVAVVVTGDEVVDAAQSPGPAQIRNSNGPMLAAAIEGLGLPSPRQLHARDERASLARALRQADADVVLLSGGVSAGRYDLVPAAVDEVGARAVFHKVTQKPGKPLLFAVGNGRLYFGLPGNPLSSYFCFQRYVAAALRRMMGLPQAEQQLGVLASALEVSCERTLFLPARVRGDSGRWMVSPLIVGSANLFACAEARAFVRLPPGEHRLAPEQTVELHWMGHQA